MAEISVKSDVTGIVCKVLVRPGDVVAEFDPMVMIESMKMEVPVAAPRAGTIKTVLVAEGEMVSDGDTTVTLST